MRVLISYSHDSVEHLDRVWGLCERLRNDGTDCRIDQHEFSPPEGWPRWCRNQVQESQFVLVVCTETYKRRYEGGPPGPRTLRTAWTGFKGRTSRRTGPTLATQTHKRHHREGYKRG